MIQDNVDSDIIKDMVEFLQNDIDSVILASIAEAMEDMECNEKEILQ